jgi:CRISPR-associated protein (TIGR02584 family)
MKHKSEKHILVAVSGNTPQIVTETLYALMIKNKPAAPISAVYIITTAKGAKIAWESLGGQDGAIARFCREYGIAPSSIAFTEDQIIRIRCTQQDSKREGKEEEEYLDDIRTTGDNSSLASQLLGLIRSLTSDPRTTLHCSMGGGRRTMSAYMMIAMTIYGREQDRLSHVLVPEEFESNRDFFFPPKKDEPLPVSKGGKLAIVHTRDAHIELADIPFARLRPLLGDQVEKVEHGWEELIRIAQQKINLDLSSKQPKKLAVRLRKREAAFGDHPIDLSGIRLALLVYFADTKLNHCVEKERSDCDGCTSCFQGVYKIDMDRFLGIYKQVFTQSPSQFETETTNLKRDGVPSDNFYTYRNTINKALADLSPALQIIREGKRGDARYGLALDKTLIEISD